VRSALPWLPQLPELSPLVETLVWVVALALVALALVWCCMRRPRAVEEAEEEAVVPDESDAQDAPSLRRRGARVLRT